MPKIVDHDQRRQAILDAAKEAFRQSGVAHTNLQTVALQAQMSKSTIYHYFPNREALISATIVSILDSETALCEMKLVDQGTVLERLTGCTQAMLRMTGYWAATGPAVLELLAQETGRNLVVETNQRVRSIITALIAAGQAEGTVRRGNPEAIAQVVVLLVNGLLMSELIEPGSTQGEEIGLALQDMLAGALAPVT